MLYYKYIFLYTFKILTSEMWDNQYYSYSTIGQENLIQR